MTEPERGTSWRTVAIAAVLVAFASLLVAAVAVGVNFQRVNDIVAARQDARVSACLSYNDDLAAKVNALNDRTQDLLEQTFNSPQAAPRAPEKQAVIDAYLKDQGAKFDAVKVAPRDCSPEGISEFYRKGNR